MAKFKADFSEGVELMLLPIDWYSIEVSSVEVTEATTGVPMLKLRLRVTGGEYENQPIFTNLMLAGRGAGITAGALRALLGHVSEDEMDTDDLVGARCRVRIGQEVWAEEDQGDGELRNRVLRWKALSSDETAVRSRLFGARR